MQDRWRITRRNLVKNTALSLPAMAFTCAAARAFAADSVPPKVDLKFVGDSDPTAKALHYAPDATKATRVVKMGVEAKDQFCKGCQFYTKAGDIAGQEAGKCLMIPGGLVNANGWCATWTKRA